MRESKQSQGNFHAVSLSGGKDSSYLLLQMIERDMPIDAVLSADTGMEFPEMYDHLQKLDDLLLQTLEVMKPDEASITEEMQALGLE